MLKFLHAADLHIDSPLRGLDRYEGAPVDAIRGATRKAFSNLVDLAIAERVAFVVLAGDIYDGDWPDYNTGLFVVKECRRLEKAGIPVVLIRGNHDAESRITARLTWPDNVRELPTDRPATIRFDSLRVAVHGQGFAHQSETRNLASEYPSAVPEWFNLGVLHTSLDGREGHADYCPCTIEQLIAKGYEYWALGHVHHRESVNGNGRVRIEFPGNIQGRHIRETGAKGCLLVTVDDQQRAVPEFRSIDVLRWAEADVTLAEEATMERVIETTADAIETARHDADGRPVAVRVKVVAPAGLCRLLHDHIERFRNEIRARAHESVWIEKVKLSAIPQEHDEPVELIGDAAAELQAALNELGSDPAAIAKLFSEGDCDTLRKKLPDGLRKMLSGEQAEIFELASSYLSGGSEEAPA